MNEYTANIDPVEREKFELLSDEWWDPDGKLRTLHHINPIRLRYIDRAVQLQGKRVLDIGCGGGILAEAMAARGALVTGIDLSPAAIDVATKHKAVSGINVEYFIDTAEHYAETSNKQFDVITCMELLEHVPDVNSLLQSCAKLLITDGHLLLATINRTVKAYMSAILAAEYLIKLLPRGTHEYKKFIRPSELNTWLRNSEFRIVDITGMKYIPGMKICTLTDDVSVNYLIHAIHQGKAP